MFSFDVVTPFVTHVTKQEFHLDISMATSSKSGALEQYLGLAPLQVAESSEAALTQANLVISALEQLLKVLRSKGVGEGTGELLTTVTTLPCHDVLALKGRNLTLWNTFSGARRILAAFATCTTTATRRTTRRGWRCTCPPLRMVRKCLYFCYRYHVLSFIILLLNTYAYTGSRLVIAENKSRAVLKAVVAALGEAWRHLEEVARLREESEALQRARLEAVVRMALGADSAVKP